MSSDSPLNVYQVLIQKYLGLETPYRGLLVYHGLGTGKTASAVSLAEGLSKEMRINTLLPASLETEFVKEVQKWGQDELNQSGLWTHKAWSAFSKDELKELSQKYTLNGISITRITAQTKRELKQRLLQEGEDQKTDIKEVTKQIKDMNTRVTELKGCFLPDPQGSSFDSLDPVEQEYVKQQIKYLIHRKYNFIHYRPFPKVKTSGLEGFVEGHDADEDEDLLEDDEDQKRRDTNNQVIVKNLEKRLKYNQKHYSVNSPFHGEVVIIDEVHNFVRQIMNNSTVSKVFYNWIVDAQEVKLVFLSGTPVINKPCEIAILYNMLKGLIRVFSFTVVTEKSIEELNEALNPIYYDKPSPIELFYVEQKGGKTVISFIQESKKFESLMDPEHDNIVYTIKTNDHSFQDFLDAIYEGLHKVSKPDQITPEQKVLKTLNSKKLKILYRGSPQVYDKDLEVVFNRQQKLFDIFEDGKLTDMTNNESFMEYFFESAQSQTLNHKRRILLKRMLMGLTSYYPIDRSSIVNMPHIVKPKIVPDAYREFPIVKDMNIIPCLMSQIQFEKYYDSWQAEKSMDKSRTMTSLYSGDGGGESPYHYHTRTRQACNIVFRSDEFRTMKKRTKDDEKEAEDLKAKTYQTLLEDKMLRVDKDLRNVSPKMFQVLRNMEKFTEGGKPSGKVLFYSDFRADAGSEAFELVLQSNGYSKFDHKMPSKEKGLRYTFITGSEGTEERRNNKEHFNAEENKFGELIQIMIISSAGAEGISLTCVRQVHVLEPYWNYVRIDQVLGRAIRMKSHSTLEKKDRNVEQYMYLSVLPPGTSIDEVFETMKGSEEWRQSTGIPMDTWSDPKTELGRDVNKGYKELFESIIRLNIDSDTKSIDQELFKIMDLKYNISQEISSVIKESSLDCIQHTRDDPELNDKCIRFSTKLQNEIAYFPGLGAKVLENVDLIQLQSKSLYFLKPNIYVVLAEDTRDPSKTIYVYYRYDHRGEDKDINKEDVDVRYIRDNGTRLCDVNLDAGLTSVYVSKDHSFNDALGKEFSVYQDLYLVNPSLIETHISQDKFPSLEKLTKKSEFHGYKLKYNVDGTFFYMTKASTEENAIRRMVPYSSYEKENYTTMGLKSLILYKGAMYVEE